MGSTPYNDIRLIPPVQGDKQEKELLYVYHNPLCLSRYFIVPVLF